MSLPVADEKIEIVRAIALRKKRGIRSRLRETQSREQSADRDQRKE
jgi:hypothetical protein